MLGSEEEQDNIDIRIYQIKILGTEKSGLLRILRKLHLQWIPRHFKVKDAEWDYQCSQKLLHHYQYAKTIAQFVNLFLRYNIS